MKSEIDLAQIGVQNPFLQACTDETRAALDEFGALRVFDSNTLLFREGDPAAVALFPLSGRLQMSKTASSRRRQVLCNVTEAGCGGVCLLLLADTSPADVRALDPGQVLVLERQEFQQLLGQCPVLGQMAWGAVAECVTHFSDLVESLSFCRVIQRVAQVLLDDTEKDGDVWRLTQSELAAEVGTTREVVARCLATLRDAGAIRLGRGRIIVLSREKLQQQI